MSYPQYPGNHGDHGQQSSGLPAPGQSFGPGYNSQPYGSQPYGSQPYGSQPYGVPGSAYPAYGGIPAYGNFNVDPVTGEPLSDKSKITAGLLQLFLGGFAAGRFYLGDMKMAWFQLGANITGVLLLIVGFVAAIGSADANSSGGVAFGGILLLLGWLWLIGVGIWIFVDAIMMFAGSVRDPQGRKLRS